MIRSSFATGVGLQIAQRAFRNLNKFTQISCEYVALLASDVPDELSGSM